MSMCTEIYMCADILINEYFHICIKMKILDSGKLRGRGAREFYKNKNLHTCPRNRIGINMEILGFTLSLQYSALQICVDRSIPFDKSPTRDVFLYISPYVSLAAYPHISISLCISVYLCLNTCLHAYIRRPFPVPLFYPSVSLYVSL